MLSVKIEEHNSKPDNIPPNAKRREGCIFNCIPSVNCDFASRRLRALASNSRKLSRPLFKKSRHTLPKIRGLARLDLAFVLELELAAKVVRI